MNAKIIFTLLLSTFLCVGYSQAQQKGKKGAPGKGQHKNQTPEERATKISNRLEKRLALDAEQKTKVYGLSLGHVTKMRGLRETQGKGKGEAFKAAREEYNKEMLAILNPTQQQEWEKMKAEAKARREERKKNAGNKPVSEEELDESDFEVGQ
jgi:hypothetical protein